MPVEREKIYLGDNFPVKFEATIANDLGENEYAFTKTPANPLTATATLRGNAGALLIDEAACVITGNEVTFTVPSTILVTAGVGQYRLYVTMTFAPLTVGEENIVITDVIPFKVLALK